MVYLPMCYLYCTRYTYPKATTDPLILSIRKEIYTCDYDDVNWDGERHSVSPLDEYDPVTSLMKFLQVRQENEEVVVVVVIVVVRGGGGGGGEDAGAITCDQDHLCTTCPPSQSSFPPCPLSPPLFSIRMSFPTMKSGPANG